MASEAVRVLLVGREAAISERIRAILTPRFACQATTREQVHAALERERFDVVVASDGPTFELLDTIREQSPATAFIVVGEAEVGRAIEAGKRGAFDYVVRSNDDGALTHSLDRARAVIQARQVGRPAPAPAEPIIIGASAILMDVLEAADRVAHSSAPVLLVGETGVGKGVLAARIHARGARRDRALVVADAAMHTALLQSELFGCLPGAFAGVTRARRGLLAEADGGTLLLDEVSDLPLDVQGRLLRVIETGLLRAVGADHERAVDVRFIASTHRDLAQAVRAGTFREDLYFRLGVLAIAVPSLRDRREDVAALVEHFFAQARARNPRSTVQHLAPSALAQLAAADWPGNVRELAGVLERLVVLGRNSTIETTDIAALGHAASATTATATSLDTLRTVSTRHVESVLAHTGGDKPRAAAILGIDVSTLYRWQRQRVDG